MQMNKVDSDSEPSLINLMKIKGFTATRLLTFYQLFVLSLVIQTSPLNAQTTSNFGIASNYIWRGITQSNEKIAASGGLDFTSTSGFYAGAWASTLSSGSYELDLYTGYSIEKEGTNYDFGIISYQYPNDNDHFNELYFSIGRSGITASFAYTIGSKDDSSAAFSQGDLYTSIAYSKELANKIEIQASLGHYDFDSRFGDDYNHLNLSASRSNFTIALDQTTNLTSDNDLTLSLAWSKTFNIK